MSFVIFNEHGEKKRVELFKDKPLSIGRSKACGVSFSGNEKVSRNHCILSFNAANSCFMVKDLNSTNGTFLNSRKIDGEAILKEGDKLGIGNILVTYHSEETSETQKLIKVKEVKSFTVDILADVELSQSSELEEKKLETQFSKMRMGNYNLLQGDTVQGYEIIRKFGEGSLAAEYLVREEGLEDIIALKIFKKEFTEAPEALVAFDEAFEKIKFSHTSFVQYLRKGLYEGCCFYTLDYMPNGNLGTRIINSAPFKELQALEILIAVAIGLGAFYEQKKIIHGNLKPSNILYNSEDGIMISDYGFSEWTSEYLLNGAPAISPWYMSPELVSGRKLDWSSDLYSLGVIFFQMLTGVLPFHSADPDHILKMHQEENFPAPGERNSNVKISEKTIQMLSVMTNKIPSERYPSWNYFIKTAQAILDDIEKKEFEIRKKSGDSSPDNKDSDPDSGHKYKFNFLKGKKFL